MIYYNLSCLEMNLLHSYDSYGLSLYETCILPTSFIKFINTELDLCSVICLSSF